uniref:Uncharacterized protein n=1 Tax=Ixodes ricinus TaxID=34613 RepID=V5IDB6_IXORI
MLSPAVILAASQQHRWVCQAPILLRFALQIDSPRKNRQPGVGTPQRCARTSRWIFYNQPPGLRRPTAGHTGLHDVIRSHFCAPFDARAAWGAERTCRRRVRGTVVKGALDPRCCRAPRVCARLVRVPRFCTFSFEWTIRVQDLYLLFVPRADLVSSVAALEED